MQLTGADAYSIRELYQGGRFTPSYFAERTLLATAFGALCREQRAEGWEVSLARAKNRHAAGNASTEAWLTSIDEVVRDAGGCAKYAAVLSHVGRPPHLSSKGADIAIAGCNRLVLDTVNGVRWLRMPEYKGPLG